MAKRKSKEPNGKKAAEVTPHEPWLKEETRNTVVAIIAIVLALFLLLAAYGNGGIVGQALYSFFSYLFGAGYYFLSVVLLFTAFSFFKSKRPKLVVRNILGSGIFFLSILGLLSLSLEEKTGGIVGSNIAQGFTKLFGYYASILILIALIIIAVILVIETRIALTELFASLFKKDDELEEEEYTEEEIPEPVMQEENVEAPRESKMAAVVASMLPLGKKIPKVPGEPLPQTRPYIPPPLDLLAKDSGKPQAGDIKANANIIKRTLQNFGILVEMDEVTIGPSITRYALKPAEGVKLARIVALQNDLSLALAAHPLRIEAPIPGKSLVGIEIPNAVKTTVRLGSVLSDSQFSESHRALLTALGKGISGMTHFADLAKMPHLLIAGTTGSGKSVTIHTLVTSLLYRNSPENLKFIMIDPKRVELTLYNKIPHLLTPVITDAKKTILALKWAGKEMQRRYDILETQTVRDIESYHTNVLKPAIESMKGKSEEEIGDLPETMPYIVIIIDELADVMSTYPREMEAAVVRLAQMSRAVGIHLVLSTQRPSTEVITGLIKANVPARVALQVPSQIDSRTIIDMPGAEKLLGSGDMLFLSGEMSKPQRIQNAFISESEVKEVVKYLAKQFENDIREEITIGGEESSGGSSGSMFDGGDGGDDELYEEARATVIQLGRASTSLLQRKLKVGYARAARLLDMLEERGVVGPGDGAKPREVYEKGGTASDEYAAELAQSETQEHDQ